MKYLIYTAPEPKDGRQDGPLEGPHGEIESQKRELHRILRKRAIQENEALQRRAASETGVRVVLVPASELAEEPMRGTVKFTLA